MQWFKELSIIKKIGVIVGIVWLIYLASLLFKTNSKWEEYIKDQSWGKLGQYIDEQKKAGKINKFIDNDFSPLMMTVYYGHDDYISRFFGKNGANPNLKNNAGNDALYYSINSLGNTVNSKQNKRSKTALKETYRMMLILIANGANAKNLNDISTSNGLDASSFISKIKTSKETLWIKPEIKKMTSFSHSVVKGYYYDEINANIDDFTKQKILSLLSIIKAKPNKDYRKISLNLLKQYDVTIENMKYNYVNNVISKIQNQRARAAAQREYARKKAEDAKRRREKYGDIIKWAEQQWSIMKYRHGVQ